MARTLIPRSDSVSAKIIEPSDFENLFSADIVQDYIKSGFTLSAGSGLACNVAAGVIRFKGLYLENDATEAVTVSASTTNAIYVKINRDGNGEAESWTFSISASGDTFQIGNALTSGSAVTSTNTSNNPNTKPGVFALNTALGGGTSGDVLYSNGTNWTKLARGSDGQYLKLTSGIPSWVTLPTHAPSTITTQHLDCACITQDNNGYTTGRLMKSVGTIANRSGGYFIATFNLILSDAGGDSAKIYFKLGGSVVAGADFNREGTMGAKTWISRTITGPTSGQTLEIWGFHNWSDTRTDILSDSGLTFTDEGGSYCDIIEVSPAS